MLQTHQQKAEQSDLTLASSLENLWNCMKQELKDICSPNLDRLQQEIKGVWHPRTSLELCRNFVKIMPCRLVTVVEANSEMAKY